MCSQPMVQAAQEFRATRRASLSASPESPSAPSNDPDWKLRVGMACSRLNVSRLATVPSSRYFAVAGANDFRDSSFAAATTSTRAPTTTRASAPVRLPARAKWDDDNASLSRDVSGDLASTANLAEVVSGVPTSG